MRSLGFRPILLIHEVPDGTKPDADQSPPLAKAPFDPEEAKQHQQTWADYLGVPVEITNSVGMKFRLIPPGEFMMGSTDKEIARLLKENWDEDWLERVPSEGPQHRVRIRRPFYVGIHEVAVGHFRAFVEATGYKTDAETDGKGGRFNVETEGGLSWEDRPGITWQNPGFDQTDAHPVVHVSWTDSMAFCRWLGDQDGKTYRLPTEAEWEYSCRSGSTTLWCYGDDESHLDQYAWFSRHGGSMPKPVRLKLPNGFGLCDVHGNVREWCADAYGDDYYSSSPMDDPTGPTLGPSRVMRGGGWYHAARRCRSAFRHDYSPGFRYGGLGFRAVLLLDDVEPPVPPKSEPRTDKPPMAVAPFTPAEAKQHQQKWADHLGVPAVETNSIDMKLTLIPPGEFMMGSTEEEIAEVLKEAEKAGKIDEDMTERLRSESPQHKVRITRPFYFAVHEVTVGQFTAFVEATGYQTEAERDGKGGTGWIDGSFTGYTDTKPELNWKNLGIEQTEKHSVVNVSWNDARTFCEWLSQLEGKKYGLPTEAQWEYACRAGSTTRWCFGDDEAKLQLYAWYFCSFPNTAGQKLPNQQFPVK